MVCLILSVLLTRQYHWARCTEACYRVMHTRFHVHVHQMTQCCNDSNLCKCGRVRRLCGTPGHHMQVMCIVIVHLKASVEPGAAPAHGHGQVQHLAQHKAVEQRLRGCRLPHEVVPQLQEVRPKRLAADLAPRRKVVLNALLQDADKYRCV